MSGILKARSGSKNKKVTDHWCAQE